MNVIEKRTRPADTYDAVVAIICDICQKKFVGADEDNWLNSSFEFEKTALTFSTGYRSPSGGNESQRAYHVCPICFTSRLEPWLRQQGANPTTEETNW